MKIEGYQKGENAHNSAISSYFPPHPLISDYYVLLVDKSLGGCTPFFAYIMAGDCTDNNGKQFTEELSRACKEAEDSKMYIA